MATNASRFARGSGVYACSCCGRNTRATGRGDNEHAGLCAECFDLSGEENHLLDNGKLYSSADEVLAMITAVAQRGDASGWADLKLAALKTKHAEQQATLSALSADLAATADRAEGTGPVRVASEAEATTVMAGRARPVLAKDAKGQLWVCSARTARKNGWTRI